MLGQFAIPFHAATQGLSEASETLYPKGYFADFLTSILFECGRHILRSTKRDYMRVVWVFRTQWYHDRASVQGIMVPQYIILPSPDVICMCSRTLHLSHNTVVSSYLCNTQS
jgi:hypothetical protein